MMRRSRRPIVLAVLAGVAWSVGGSQPRAAAPASELPRWAGVWAASDGIMERIGVGLNLPEGPGPGLFERRLNQHPPYNPEWEAKFQALRAAMAHAPMPVAKESCSWYFPAMMEGPYLFEVLITPQETALIFEGSVRHVLTDGRRHPPAEDRWPTPWGDSIGHWEGGTLVVDTTDVARDPTPFFAMVSPAAHYTERLRLVTADHLQDQLTVTDPLAFTRPWTVTLDYTRVKNMDRLIHGDCTQNDRDAVEGGTFKIKPP
jgi:hypothetical protein